MNIPAHVIYENLAKAVDQHGCGPILETLRDICTDNARQLHEEFGDDKSAGEWECDASTLATAAAKIRVKL